MKEVKAENLIKVTIKEHYTKTKVILAEIDEEDRKEVLSGNDGYDGIGYIDGSDYNIEVSGWNVNTIKILDEYEDGFENQCGKYYCGEGTITHAEYHYIKDDIYGLKDLKGIKVTHIKEYTGEK